MKLTVKLIISVAVAAVATAVTTWYLGEGQTAPVLFIAFCAATLATTLLVSMPLAGTAPAAASSSQKAPRTSRQAEPRQAEPLQAGAKPARGTRPVAAAVTSGGAGTRQHGKVKWFNVSKGFGFITRDDGEEIFVHFRSIRGGGRRGLRDGQKVSFIVADSDKGPQAEDVEALD